LRLLPNFAGPAWAAGCWRFAEAARARGAARLLLEMRRGNPADSLYLRHGFVPVGLRPNYYSTRSGPRLDAITFSCPKLGD
jgi:ribosomal-protein-alanine N-acetyltransferase